MTDIIVVGAGVVGLSTAYWLVKAGLSVTVIEQGAIPNPTAASADHHRLIRYPYGTAEGYCARMQDAFTAWRDMWVDLPGSETRYYAATGILSASQYDGDFADLSRAAMDRLGIPYERIEADAIARRFAFLETANLSYAMLSEGGALMANHILTDLADWLRAEGADIREHAPVAQISPSEGTVTLADTQVLGADRVIVAAGISTAQLVPDLELTLTPHRTVIVYATPPDDLAELYADAPCWTYLGGDTALWGMPAVAGLPMKLGNGTMGRPDPEVASRAMQPDEIRRMLRDYAIRFRGAERFTVRWHQANYWTHAPNEQFALAALDRVLAVSACSGHGFKFGALSGRDVSDCVLNPSEFPTIRARMAGLDAD